MEDFEPDQPEPPKEEMAYFQCCCGLGIFMKKPGESVLWECPDMACGRIWMVAQLERRKTTVAEACVQP